MSIGPQPTPWHGADSGPADCDNPYIAHALFHFDGEVSRAQGGGFASVRAAVARPGDTGASGLCIEALGDGRAYTLSLFMDGGFDAAAYQAVFTLPAGRWQKLHLPLAQFVSRFRGRPVVGAPPLQAARICQVGLLIAARQAGPFTLGVRAIELC